MPEISEQLAELGKQTTTFREYVERELSEVKKYGTALPETKAALDKLTAAMDESEQRYNEMKARLEKAEEKLGRPGAVADGDEEKKAEVEAMRKAQARYMRVGKDGLSPDEIKALAVSSDPSGGYWAVPQRQNTMIEYLVQRSPIREIAQVIQCSGHTLEIPKETAAPTVSWTAEEGTRSEASYTPAGLEKIPTHEMQAIPYATMQMIEDSSFDLEGYLDRKAGVWLGAAEGTAFVSGNGVTKPFGLMSDTNISYTAQVEASTLTNGDGIISLIHALNSEYAVNAKMIMNRATLGLIRKLKGGDGHYLWWPDYTGANPPSIQGVQYVECPDMPSVTTNTYPILYGDFQYYVIADRTQITLLRDPFTGAQSGVVKFFYRKRVGGKVTLPAAFRKLKIAAS